MIGALIVVAGLAVATVLAFMGAHAKHVMARERAVSNLRVLREYKRMTIHRPHYIVDYRTRTHRKAQP